MKKELTLPMTLLVAALLLTACSTKSATSTSTTSQSSTTSSTTSTSSSTDTSSSTEPTTTSLEMDIDAISQGDYTSISGTWQNSAGNTLVFDATGLISDGVSLSQTGTVSDGVYETTVSATTSGIGGFGLVMIPKGTVIPSKYLTEGSSDTTDSSQDRMFTAQGVIAGDAVDAYYRVSDSTDSSTDPLKDTNTGVSLESGQVTLDYAISILGDKNWVAIESNYNRTEAIPFELLQGNDGSLYRIYQNGVIVEDTQNQIVYQP